MADPDLADLDAFAAVARARSFRGAAAMRGVSASSLSEALRRLEARLGVRLLNRTTRSVTPTEAGERLLERLVAGARRGRRGARRGQQFPRQPDRHAAAQRADHRRPRSSCRRSSPRFLTQHPGIVLEVTADDSFIDVLAAGFDAGVRYDERLEQDMIAVPIGPREQRFVAAGAPSYLAAHGRPAHPRDLLDHACIRHRFPSGVTPAWEFERDGEVIKVAPQGPLIATSGDLEIGAAIAGLGYPDLRGLRGRGCRARRARARARRLVAALLGAVLYYASRRHMPAPLRAFVDFLKRENRS